MDERLGLYQVSITVDKGKTESIKEHTGFIVGYNGLFFSYRNYLGIVEEASKHIPRADIPYITKFVIERNPDAVSIERFTLERQLEIEKEKEKR